MHRAINQGLAETRRAKLLVQPFTPPIRTWQARTAQAAAIITARHTTDVERVAVLTELAEVAAQIDGAVERLDAALADATPELASHARVQDVQRALSTLRSKLADLRTAVH